MRTRRTGGLAAAAILGFLILEPSSGCGSSSSGGANATGDDGGSGGASSSGSGCVGFSCANSGGDDSGVPTTTCMGGTAFQCQQVSCPGTGTTTIHGTVYDPAGVLPLYNVAVYVPNTAPVVLPEGVSCESCGSWYTAPVVSAITDAGGNFTLTNAPVGKNIPLIVQVGKWRMSYTLSNVQSCMENDAAALAGTKLHLPRNHMEGHIPNIAISTGALDSLECLIRRMGIDAKEYTGNPTTGVDQPRIHIFTGGNSPAGMGGAQTQNPTSKQSYQYLWSQDPQMEAFDLVLLSCEGLETSYLSDVGRQVMADYTAKGGRVFASHYHYAWFTPTGPFANANLAKWSPEGTPGKVVTVGPNGDDGPPVTANVITTLPNGQPFPEGVALHQWLTNVGALTNDKLPIWYARHNADVTTANKPSQGWIQLDSTVASAPNATEYFSFDTPVNSAENRCGRVVYSDLHVSGGINAQNDPSVMPDYPGVAITPDGCAMHPLTPQEKALEFMIFDLSSCLTPIGETPPPPALAK